MKVGVIGLGRMGSAITERLLKAKHEVIGFDPNPASCQEIIEQGGSCAQSLVDVAKHARILWLMVPAGKPVDDVLVALEPSLQVGDVIIDGGNSHYPDTKRRAEQLAKRGIYYLDCGTSGGIHGRENGFSLMIGGNVAAFTKVEEIFQAIAAQDGYAYLGPSGAGHYVKMVHNGIEYALLQAYAEGYHVLREGTYHDLDLAAIARVWQHGAIIRSFINELCENIFEHDQLFEDVSGAIGENLTGRWTMDEADACKIPVDLIKRAVELRAWSRKTGGNYATKLVALLRNAFGGHTFEKKK